MAAARPLSSRYAWLKAMTAVETALADLRSRAASGARLSLGDSAAAFAASFKEAYQKPLTTVICFAGAAMVPNLNRAALEDKAALEKLVVRLIPTPSPRNIAVGDVVAFNSPIASHGKNVMVRRVAALEAHPMVSDDPEDDSFHIPPGHCWVLADNEALAPPDVADSRAFGYLPMTSIVGRAIYKVASLDSHGPVTNSPISAFADAPVVEAEVDVEALAADLGDDGGEEEP